MHSHSLALRNNRDHNTQLRADSNSVLPTSGYAGGNLINLCCHLQINLTGYDFSHLTIWQAYLQGTNLHDVNLSHSNLAKSVFTQTFGSILSVAFSPDGKFLAAGDSKDEIRLWRVADGQQLLICQIIFPEMTQIDITGPHQVFAFMPNTQIYWLWKNFEPVS